MKTRAKAQQAKIRANDDTNFTGNNYLHQQLDRVGNQIELIRRHLHRTRQASFGQHAAMQYLRRATSGKDKTAFDLYTEISQAMLSVNVTTLHLHKSLQPLAEKVRDFVKSNDRRQHEP